MKELIAKLEKHYKIDLSDIDIAESAEETYNRVSGIDSTVVDFEGLKRVSVRDKFANLQVDTVVSGNTALAANILYDLNAIEED